MPHLQTVADELCIVRSMYTEQFNHAPAQLFVHTGSPRLGRPGMGCWLSYGLGTENRNLPSFCVLVSGTAAPDGGASLWGSGFLPTIHQGVQLRSQGDPVLFLSNPDGMDAAGRRQVARHAARPSTNSRPTRSAIPKIATRIAQYEMAYRMQTSVPDVMDISKETKETHEMYGAKPGQKAFANNCLLARRLVESGVRFVQLYHWGWDSHGESKATDLRYGLVERCKETDQPIAALIKDLKRRGLLDHTLVVWGGEFGRTPMNEERNGSKWLGRDHHQHTFTIWMAGGGVEARHNPRHDGRTGLPRRRRRRPRPRPAGHHAAPDGHESREADLPLPGPRLPADRRAWQRGERTAGVREPTTNRLCSVL